MNLTERITNALKANQIILSMKHGQVIKTHLVKIDRLLGDIRQDLAKPVEFNKNGAQKKEKKDLTVKDLKKLLVEFLGSWRALSCPGNF